MAFAFNSILTRLALAAPSIDAATFTAVRLLSGAVVLAVIVRVRAGDWSSLAELDVWGTAVLFIYAAPFSFAYLRIGAATGALVLFGVVQLTMIGWGIARGERPRLQTWSGFALAFGGLLLLTLPSASQPDLAGVALMAVAGVAWGAYSILGQRSRQPILTNARSFLWSIPLTIPLVLLAGPIMVTSSGLALAVAAGGVTSGVGYVIWYRALGGLQSTQAAIVQLSVPVIAALGGVLLLGEDLHRSLILSGAAVLGGVALALSGSRRR